MKSYIKVYPSVLNNPLMGTLSDHLYRVFIELSLLALKNNDEGRLPEIEEIAWALRTTITEIHMDMDYLTNISLLGFEHGLFSTVTEVR